MQTREIKWIGSDEDFFPDRDGYPIKFIVDHISQGSLKSMDNWFNTDGPDVSAHYGVGRNGEIHQYVEDKDGAWSNGYVSNMNDGTYPITNPMLIEFGDVSPNLLSISIEHEGMSGEPLTEEQYQSTLWLHKQLIAKYGIEANADHIIGHYRIDPETRSGCPGPAFPWERLINDINKPEEPEQPKLYRVQVGAYKNKASAVKLANELKSKGYKAIIKEG